MVIRRRNRSSSHRAHSSSSSSGVPSFLKSLSNNSWLSKWFKKPKRDHAHKPPAALHHRHTVRLSVVLCLFARNHSLSSRCCRIKGTKRRVVRSTAISIIGRVGRAKEELGAVGDGV